MRDTILLDARSIIFLRIMIDSNTAYTLDPQPKLALQDPIAPSINLGVVANYPDSEETRFPLTPEACGLLTSGGVNIMMESDAGVDISFSDEAYAEYGVQITSREEALKCPVVLSYEPLRIEDVYRLSRGATLLCIMNQSLFDNKIISALLEREITLGCLDNMLSHNDEPIFASIIDEIDGRAAVMYAQDHLSFLGGGKGVLLAGVAGINPCEVLVIGEGTDVCAAASAAIDAGATVTLLNNDISTLQVARQYCGTQLTTLAIHPRVLYNKIKTADVILMGNCTRPFELPKKLMLAMKESAFLLNFNETHPSMSVPRTVAMAVSNLLVNFFNEMVICDGFEQMMITTDGVQQGIVTYRGQLVDKLIASYLSLPSVDLKVMLTASN